MKYVSAARWLLAIAVCGGALSFDLLANATRPEPTRLSRLDGGVRPSFTVDMILEGKIVGGDGGVESLFDSGTRNQIVPPPDQDPDVQAEPKSSTRAVSAAPPTVPNASRDPFDDVVAVGNPSRYDCTGILIADIAVITARHCLSASRVLFGQNTATALRTRSVVATAPHPTMDVALLRIAPMQEVAVRQRAHAAPAGEVRIVGFGTSDVFGRAGFGVKRQADVPATGWGCDRSRASWTHCDPATEMVLTTTEGGDTCRGDSGGPVLVRGPHGWELIAITSRSLPVPGRPCGDGGIYERIDVIAPWLDSMIRTWRGTP